MNPHRILLTAGSNAKGQLGIGSCDDVSTFTPCQFVGCEASQLPSSASKVVQIACGANHTVLLLEHLDGSTTLWGTGDGRKGQLGTGSTHSDSTLSWTTFHELVLPHSMSYGYKHKLIAAAWETTYVVLSCPRSPGSDILLSLGSNDLGALGVGGENGPTPGEPRVVDFGHLLPDDGHARTIRIQSLHAGPRHVVVQLVTTGSGDSTPCPQTALVGWGASRHGQLGQHGGLRFVAQPALLHIDIDEDPMASCGLGNQHTVVLHASGRISALGSNKQGQIPSIGSQKHVCRVGCTWNGTYMQATDGAKQVLLSTGNNAQGQLGRGHTIKSCSACEETINLPGDCAISSFVCGSEHVLVALSGSSQGGSSVLGWGWNEHGNMGLGSFGNITTPTQLWPREGIKTYDMYPQKVIGIWAGCATSWLLVE